MRFRAEATNDRGYYVLGNVRSGYLVVTKQDYEWVLSTSRIFASYSEAERYVSELSRVNPNRELLIVGA